MDDYDRSLASNRNDTTDDFKDVYFGSQDRAEFRKINFKILKKSIFNPYWFIPIITEEVSPPSGKSCGI